MENEKVQDLFKLYRGRQMPVYRWKNHEDISYWYNFDKKQIETSCGVSITFPKQNEEISLVTIDNSLNLLEDLIIDHFKKHHNKQLYTPDD